MLIESRVTTLLEGMRKLQSMVQASTGVSLLDKIRSQEILTECEEQLYSSFGIKQSTTFERVKITDTSMSTQELTNKVSTIAHDSQSIFKILKSMPATRGKNILFLRKREDNHLVENKFTSKKGHIRAEFGNDDELFYIVQYEDGSYNISAEVNIQFL